MDRRMERVNATLKRELGSLIANRLVDPRLGTLPSVTRVQTGRDLGVATVYVTLLGGADERAATLEALHSASGKLRGMLKKRVRMRNIPRLRFQIDESAGRDSELLALIDAVAREDAQSRQSSEGS